MGFEFPTMLYKGGDPLQEANQRTVRNFAELEQAIADGYSGLVEGDKKAAVDALKAYRKYMAEKAEAAAEASAASEKAQKAAAEAEKRAAAKAAVEAAEAERAALEKAEAEAAAAEKAKKAAEKAAKEEAAEKARPSRKGHK